MAVSYTHLDVYKRQDQTASEAEVGQEIDQVIADAEGRVIVAAVGVPYID